MCNISARHILWKGKCSLFPHPWNVTTLIFKVVSFASGPKRESCCSGKSPVSRRNSSSGSSLGFCKYPKITLKGQILNDKHENEHSFKHASFSCVQIQWVNVRSVSHLDTSEPTFFHLEAFLHIQLYELCTGTCKYTWRTQRKVIAPSNVHPI